MTRLAAAWLVRCTEDAAHVMPIRDLRSHCAEMTCWCCPQPDPVEEDVIVHNAMDRRELYERGELLPH